MSAARGILYKFFTCRSDIHRLADDPRAQTAPARAPDERCPNEEAYPSPQASAGACRRIAPTAACRCIVLSLLENQGRTVGWHRRGDQYRPQRLHDAESRTISADGGGGPQGQR